MKHLLTLTMHVEVEAPTIFDANEIISDTFGSAFDIRVIDLEAKPSRKKKTKE